MKKKMNFKRILLCAILMIASFDALAYSSETQIDSTSITVISEDSIKNIIIEDIIDAIVYVESGGRLNAVNGSCCGPMQISPGMVTGVNRILKSNGATYQFTLKDRFNLEKSKEMFRIYNRKHNPSFNIEKAIRSWNGGLGYKISSTQHYYNKVMKYYNAHKHTN